MGIKIYKFEGSPPARSVLMTVELIGLKVEFVEVNTMKGEQFDPKYMKKNPTHTQPLLQDGDFFLADSHAIITYLVSKYGGHFASLYPDDLETRATINQRLFFDATSLYPQARAIGSNIFVNRSLGASPEQIDEVNAVYGFLEKYLENSMFLVCEVVTLADVSCVASVSSLNVLVPIDETFAKLRAWLKRMEGKDWYQKANVPGLRVYENAFTAQMKKNVEDARGSE